MDWWKLVTAAVAALGAGWTLKLFVSNRSSRSDSSSKIRRANIVSQKNNRAGGDIVGGDLHKK